MNISELCKYIPENMEIDFEKDFMKYGISNDNKITAEDVDADELEKGIQIEMEHTSDPIIAIKIALDHLAMFDKYYTYLINMRDEMSKAK